MDYVQKSKPKRKYSELHEQRQVVTFLERQQVYGRVLKFTSIPNSTWSPSWGEINRNKASGLNPGLPDLFILLPSLNGKPARQVWIEMKRPRRMLLNGQLGASPSKVSEEQLEWIRLLMIHPDVIAIIAYGAEMAINLLTELIGDVSTPQTTTEERDKSFAEFSRFVSR